LLQKHLKKASLYIESITLLITDINKKVKDVTIFFWLFFVIRRI